MSFFKPEDFGWECGTQDNDPMDCETAARIANAKLEQELGNEYAIVTHFKAENERLRKALKYYADHQINGSKSCGICKSVTILTLGDNGQRARNALKFIYSEEYDHS